MIRKLILNIEVSSYSDDELRESQNEMLEVCNRLKQIERKYKGE